MTLNYITLLAFLCFVCLCSAQEINPGPRITALGRSGVALQDIWSIQSNQSGIAHLKRPAAFVAFQSHYLNSDLSTKSGVFAYPSRQGVFGFSVQRYGFAAYNNQKLGFAYAKPFGESLSIALNFNLHQISIDGYGNARTYSIETGFQYSISEELLFAAHITNPNKSAFNSSENAYIPTILEIGAAYRLSDKLLLNGSIVKDLDIQADFRLGMEYCIGPWFALRTGINTNPFMQFTGFGCHFQGFYIDGALSHHNQLGYSPQLAIGYEF